jgi:hypothetical protein
VIGTPYIVSHSFIKAKEWHVLNIRIIVKRLLYENIRACFI